MCVQITSGNPFCNPSATTPTKETQNTTLTLQHLHSRGLDLSAEAQPLTKRILWNSGRVNSWKITQWGWQAVHADRLERKHLRKLLSACQKELIDNLLHLKDAGQGNLTKAPRGTRHTAIHLASTRPHRKVQLPRRSPFGGV